MKRPVLVCYFCLFNPWPGNQLVNFFFSSFFFFTPNLSCGHNLRLSMTVTAHCCGWVLWAGQLRCWMRVYHARHAAVNSLLGSDQNTPPRLKLILCLYPQKEIMNAVSNKGASLTLSDVKYLHKNLLFFQCKDSWQWRKQKKRILYGKMTTKLLTSGILPMSAPLKSFSSRFVENELQIF